MSIRRTFHGQIECYHIDNSRKVIHTGRIRILIIWTLLLTLAVALASVQAQTTEEGKDKQEQIVYHWGELMHYATIANFELAKGHGEKLLELNPDPVLLLNLAESDQYAPSYRNLWLMQQNTPLKDVVTKILNLVEKGRHERRTDPQRIRDELKRLSGTTRGRMLAISRLKDSGEWAVPFFIEALCDPTRNAEYSILRWALPKLGQVAVNPLVMALQKCQNLNTRIIILYALGEIGDKNALPYIQQLAEDPKVSLELKNAALSTIQKIDPIKGAGGMTAAMLFENLALDYYNHLPSLEVPADQDLGNIWFWDHDNGLIMEQVPRGAFDELMTMRCSEQAVSLDPRRADAISLWLSGFFRLEDEGYKQPKYFGPDHPDASTYALTTGPEYLHRVLARALENHNRPVALSAIRILQRNAGQQSLLFTLNSRQPLIDSLSFPDREVRFSAALAVGGVLPKNDFINSELTVPTLAEALRQKGQRYALVASDNQEQRNQLAAQLRESGAFAEVIGDQFFSVAVESARKIPSLDLIVLTPDVKHPNLDEVMTLIKSNPRLTFCPMLIVAKPEAVSLLRKYQEKNSFAEVIPDTLTVEQKLEVANNILYRNHARPFASDLADSYATQAAMVLQQLAVAGNKVLPLKPAEGALIEALGDTRKVIQNNAIITLARMDSYEAQRALAELALDETADMTVRLHTFRNLAVSAKNFGNLLLSEQVDAIYTRLVSSLEADPELRNLAAEAYGSLNLPSAKISELIISQISNSGYGQ